MRFNRRRSDRPDSARSRLGSSLETLEGAELLSQTGSSAIFAVYAPERPAGLQPDHAPAGPRTPSSTSSAQPEPHRTRS